MEIKRWSSDHAQLPDLRSFIEAHGQLAWFDFAAEWHLASHILVASAENQIVGFLRFVVQEIGPEYDRPSVTVDGAALTEAKVLAFAVGHANRRFSIGSQLQHEAITQARELGCYQVRSFSSGSNVANHALKLKLGFAACPDPRHDDPNGLCFVLPLAGPTSGGHKR